MAWVKAGVIAFGLLLVAVAVRDAYLWAVAHETAIITGVLLVVLAIITVVFSGPFLPRSAPRPRRRMVDDFGRSTTAEHPWVVTASVAAPTIPGAVAQVGVDRFLAACTIVAGPRPDPAHPGGMPIALWRPPRDFGRILVLECFNGTPGPDGRYERLAKGVAHSHRTPIAAAAASYGVPVEVYRQLERRV